MESYDLWVSWYFRSSDTNPYTGIGAQILIKFHRPEDPSWEGGTFNLTLEFSEEYPNKAPQVKFVSKLFHPNGMGSKTLGKDFWWLLVLLIILQQFMQMARYV